MTVGPIQVDVVRPGTGTLLSLLDKALTDMPEASILVITSKIISLCEGRVIPIAETDRDRLIEQEADYYLPASFSKYGHHFTIKNNTIVGSAGIDQSNGDGNYVLWPADAQATANQVRGYLCKRFGVRRAGVLITDSTSYPLRLGSMGVALTHSGFRAMHDYIGQKDLFDHLYGVTRANVAGGLAAAATVVMGEGTERTPLCLLGDLPFVEFQERNPTARELEQQSVTLDDDLFAPFLRSVPWKRSEKHS